MQAQSSDFGQPGVDSLHWYGFVSRILGLFALAIAYFIGGRLGLFLAVPPGFASAVWPASGIALGALLVFGPRMWPGILLGSFCVNVSTSFDGTDTAAAIRSTVVCTVIGAGAALQAFAGYWMIRRTVKNPITLDEAGGIVRFMVLGGPVACLVNASIGVGALYVIGAVPVANIAFNWSTWWVGDVIGVLVFAPLTMIAIGQPRATWRPRMATVGLPLTAVFGMVVMFFMFARNAETKGMKQSFEQRANEMAGSIAEEVSNNLGLAYGVERFFANSSQVTREEFHGFAGSMVKRRPGLAALSWNQIVPERDRESFEKKIRDDGRPDFKIKAVGGTGVSKLEGRGGEHVVVTYIEPQSENASVLGLDVASESERLKTIELARDNGKPAATGPLVLQQGGAGGTGMLVFIPVYANGTTNDTVEARRAHIRGYITSVIQYDRLIGAALKQFDRKGFEVSVRDQEKADPIYLESGGVKSATNRNVDKSERYVGLGFNVKKEFAGRSWIFSFAPTQAYLAEHRAWDVWLVLAGGLGLSSMLGVFLLVLTGRTMRISAMVDERTNELSRVNGALAEGEARFRTLVEGAEVVVWELDCDTGCFTYVSPQARKFGYEMEAWYTKGFWAAHIHEEDRKFTIAYRETELVAGRGYRSQYRLVAADGRSVWVDDVVSVERRTGKAPLLRGVMVDITARMDTLAALETAQAKAEEASKAKSAFLANMSHEIRTPLTAILGFADILREDGETALTPEQRIKTLDTIRNAGTHLLTVINDILDLSKIEADKMTVERIDTPLVGVLREVESLMRPRAVGKGLKLSATLTTAVPERIKSDPTRLRQILMNLTGNAVKFTEAGNVEIQARVTNRSGAEVLAIEVKDTGPGMSEGESKRLFQAFAQADGTVTRKFGGSGLGLTICKRLAGLMGGTVELVWTEVGKGSTFRVELPLEAAPGAKWVTRMDAVQDESRNENAEVKLRGRMLLAEDGADNLRLISFHLRKAGATVEVAENGVMALKLIEENKAAGTPFELLLTDMQMPEMDGYTLARTLRQRGSRIPIVALTAHAMAEDRAKCVEAGCDDYASKPIEKMKLLATCAQWIGKVSGTSLAA